MKMDFTDNKLGVMKDILLAIILLQNILKMKTKTLKFVKCQTFLENWSSQCVCSYRSARSNINGQCQLIKNSIRTTTALCMSSAVRKQPHIKLNIPY